MGLFTSMLLVGDCRGVGGGAGALVSLVSLFWGHHLLALVGIQGSDEPLLALLLLHRRGPGRRRRHLAGQRALALLGHRPRAPALRLAHVVDAPHQLPRPLPQRVVVHVAIRLLIEPVAQICELRQPAPHHLVDVSFHHTVRRGVHVREVQVLQQQQAVLVALDGQRLQRVRGQRERRVREERGVLQQWVGAEHAVGTRGLQAVLRLGVGADVAVGNHGDRERLFYLVDESPVGAHVAGALLLAGAAVHRHELRARRLHHLGVRDAGLQVVVHADLRRDGHAQLLVQLGN
mmetsp:Transcript_18780/g.46767  ORF Transcript_18780/g.46767 Transcript_18780/m.46767 type:complete len:290 (-) Transcript_18780:595-1464(-)